MVKKLCCCFVVHIVVVVLLYAFYVTVISLMEVNITKSLDALKLIEMNSQTQHFYICYVACCQCLSQVLRVLSISEIIAGNQRATQQFGSNCSQTVSSHQRRFFVFCLI